MALTASRRRPSRGRHVSDPCPVCHSDLGGAGSTTRRRPVWGSTPGTFTWSCPDCKGQWQEGPAPRRIAAAAR